jgi:hypothetical protein
MRRSSSRSHAPDDSDALRRTHRDHPERRNVDSTSIPDGIVRHIVATVDGLPQKTLAMRCGRYDPQPGRC